MVDENIKKENVRKKNRHLLFEVPDNESEKWYRKAYELECNNDEVGFKKHLKEASEKYFKEYNILDIIRQLTKEDVAGEKWNELIEQLKQAKPIKALYDDNGFINLVLPDQTIRFKKLSDYFPNLKDKNILVTDERHGMCFDKSYELCSQLEISSEIVTGYIYTLCNKTRYLHTWLELDINGEAFVIDFTLNLVMNKRGYYFLRHAEPISRISHETAEEDLKWLPYLDLEIREYLLYRDEIAEDIDRFNKRSSKK